VTSINIRKGTVVSSPIRAMNRSEAFWGSSAKDYIPERWLEDVIIPAKEISGPRHILTFSDGPRLCLGRSFALAEFKVSLSTPFLYCSMTSVAFTRPRTIIVTIGGFIGPYPQLHVRAPRGSCDEDRDTSIGVEAT
jgi:cytochrome P450